MHFQFCTLLYILDKHNQLPTFFLVAFNCQKNARTKIVRGFRFMSKNSIVHPTIISQNSIISNCLNHISNILNYQMVKLMFVIIDLDSKLCIIDRIIKNYKPLEWKDIWQANGALFFMKKKQALAKKHLF